MSGVSASACFTLGAKTMAEPLGFRPNAPHDLSLRHRRPSPSPADRGLSRAERLEIVSLIAAAGISECSGWVIPVLERSGLESQEWRD